VRFHLCAIAAGGEPEPHVPKKKPDAEFTISSRGELAAALEVLARVEAVEARVKAEMEAELAAVKQRFEERLYLDHAGERHPCAVVKLLLMTAAVRFATEHPDRVFTGPTKTERFTHGEVSARRVPPAVQFAEGQTKSSVLKVLQERSGILKKLPAWLQKLPLWRTRTADQLLKVSVDLVSCTEVKKQLDQGKLDAQDLEKAGYVLTGEREAISVKAYEHVVRAEAA
jgi:phage host-nuclease inhibitor protein Gam